MENLASVPSKDLVGKERTNYTIYGVLEKIHYISYGQKKCEVLGTLISPHCLYLPWKRCILTHMKGIFDAF